MSELRNPCWWPTLVLLLVACTTNAPSTRAFPLVSGSETRSAVRRADINADQSGPPPVPFDVDCTALPYAKGEERDFCYRYGHWAVVHHPRGILVACSCGEFGGFVSWYGAGGTLRQTLVAGDLPQTIVCDDDALVCVTGITHLSISEGAMHSFRLVEDRWDSVNTMPLDSQPERVAVEADGSLLVELKLGGGTLRYREGETQRVHE